MTDNNNNKELLRFLTCGSVDDGKSTLIGRLLYDTKLIFKDQLEGLKKVSQKFGTNGSDIDFALLVDGLEAEREQGITIDVAYRFFETAKRKFIVADTPGHEQYTRNMVTGASNCEVVIILIDATKGLLPQTKRHSFIVLLLGIKKIIIAINKIDLVDYSEKLFNDISEQYKLITKNLCFETITIIPVSARFGDNIQTQSLNTKWYKGVTLLECLENIDITYDLENKPFRMPIQWVNRPNQSFRGFTGTIATGKIKIGSRIFIAPSGKTTKIKEIITPRGNTNFAIAQQAITITTEDEIDISRGDVLSTFDKKPLIGDQIRAKIVWFDEDKLICGKKYLLKTSCKTTSCQIDDIRFLYDINNFSRINSKELSINDIASVDISTDDTIAVDPYNENKQTGNFILIDRITKNTIAAGMITSMLRRADNVKWQTFDNTKESRAKFFKQKPVILWFTGLSGSGKSTIANIVERKLMSMGRYTYLLDGDNIRQGLNKDLGFSDIDREENIRRIGEVSKLMIDAGLIILTAFISPFAADRAMARNMVKHDEFIEIYIKTPLEIAEMRDVKGLYKKARAGKIANFTGIDSPYEEPKAPEITIETISLTAEEAAENIINYLQKNNYII